MSYKIGEVIEILEKDYKDITPSALRYWEKIRLLPPIKDASGGKQRLYTDKDIETIKLIKELSLSGYSIKEIKKRVLHEAQEGLESAKKKFGWNDMLTIFRNTRELAKQIEELSGTKKTFEGNWYDYIYTRDVLMKLLNDNRAEDFIKRTEEYKLIFPRIIDGEKKYNRMDEMILRTFIKYNSNYLEKCKKLYDVIEYLKGELDIPLTRLFLPFGISGDRLLKEMGFKDLDKKQFYFLTLIIMLEEKYYSDVRSLNR